jgi:hypothetical protein
MWGGGGVGFGIRSLGNRKKRRTLDFALVDWRERRRRAEERDDIRAAGDRAEVYSCWECVVDICKCRRRERRAGGVDCAQGFQGQGSVWLCSCSISCAIGIGAITVRRRLFAHGINALLLQDTQVLRTRAEMCNPQLLNQQWHGHFTMWLKGTSVVQDYGGAGGEPRDEPVPHHPGACCEVEEPVAGSDVAVDDVFFFVLD